MSRKKHCNDDPGGLVHSVATVRAAVDRERDQVRLHFAGLMMYITPDKAIMLARQIVEACDVIESRRPAVEEVA
ncbi:hypothetical protein [Gordonia zhaorongruii]|uniref:hypothetical protein n=1 Tax=Gordonia zhaorongruii TaxID=2597659 RepID=UPI00117D2FFF|nr:hypothetical protein [Gordonia zhaorongruii]